MKLNDLKIGKQISVSGNEEVNIGIISEISETANHIQIAFPDGTFPMWRLNKSQVKKYGKGVGWNFSLSKLLANKEQLGIYKNFKLIPTRKLKFKDILGIKNEKKEAETGSNMES